jgi:hypothetical protein
MLPLQQFASACPRDFKLDSTTEATVGSISLTVTDEKGDPVDVVSAVGGTGTDLPAGYTAKYTVKEAHWAPVLWTEDAVAAAPSVGEFQVDLGTGHTKYPGVYLAELAVFDDNDQRRFSEMRYLEIAPTLNTFKHSGPPTIAEVRLYLRDTPADNTLLDDVEFSSVEVMAALRRPIDIFNETPPDLCRYTAATFPWREHWMQAAVGYLMQTAAYHYSRNELTYSSGGLSAVDKDKGRVYQQVAAEKIAEFKEWMMRKKVEMNMDMGYGTLNSPYA